MIKKLLLSMSLLLSISFSSCDELQDIVDAAATGTGGGLSTTEVARGLKQALIKGAQNGTNELSRTNGYFKNPSVKILFPPAAQKVENTLRNVGLGNMVDRTIEKLNRAAEDAAPKAKDIFVNAITKMTINDAMNILMGSKNAATTYLKRVTTQSLYQAFNPVINRSLSSVGATQVWNEVITRYNNFPTTGQNINPDLDDHVTNKAIDGIFVMIEKEERAIRANPAKRTTDILRKVFAKQD